jgi:hypothetical protein
LLSVQAVLRKRKTSALDEPIFYAKTLDTCELADISGDQRGTQRIGMGCDQEVVGADRFASGFKLGANSAIFSIGRDIQWKDLEPAQNGFDLLEQARGPLTSATVAQLGRGDDADTQIVAPDLDDLIEHRALRISNEIGDDVGIEHVA